MDGHHNNMRSTTNEFKPYDELLLWAVLCNMQEMALFMWERGDENLARALVAAKLYNAMARLTESDDAISDVTEDLYAHFELVWCKQQTVQRKRTLKATNHFVEVKNYC